MTVKTSLKLFSVSAIAALAVLGASMDSTTNCSDLELANIEALTGPEIPDDFDRDMLCEEFRNHICVLEWEYKGEINHTVFYGYWPK